MSGNNHAPRHNDTRRERMQNHTPWWRRIPSWRRVPQWVGIAGLLAGLVIAGGEHTAHLLADDAKPEHSHAAEPAAATEVVVEYSVPESCLQAMSHAEDGLDAGGGHIRDMVHHIEETGSVGREHNEDMRDLVHKLDKIRERYETAKLGCQLEPPEPTTGGGT